MFLIRLSQAFLNHFNWQHKNNKLIFPLRPVWRRWETYTSLQARNSVSGSFFFYNLQFIFRNKSRRFFLVLRETSYPGIFKKRERAGRRRTISKRWTKHFKIKLLENWFYNVLGLLGFRRMVAAVYGLYWDPLRFIEIHRSSSEAIGFPLRSA